MTKNEILGELQRFRPNCGIEWRSDGDALFVEAFVDEIGCRHSGFVIQFHRSGEFDPEFDMISFGTKFYTDTRVSTDQVNELNKTFRIVRHFWDDGGLVVCLDTIAPSAVLQPEVFEQNYAMFDSALDRIQLMTSK